jgi:hypothetical protein
MELEERCIKVDAFSIIIIRPAIWDPWSTEFYHRERNGQCAARAAARAHRASRTTDRCTSCFRGAPGIDTCVCDMNAASPRGVPALQQLFRRLRPVDVGAAARWGLLVGLTAFWFIEPYDWIRSTFKNSETDDETKQPK